MKILMVNVNRLKQKYMSQNDFPILKIVYQHVKTFMTFHIFTLMKVIFLEMGYRLIDFKIN